MRHTKKYIKEKYKMLPESIKSVMGSVETVNIINFIVEKNKLHIDTAGTLAEEILFVGVGAEKASDLIKNLKRELDLPDEKVNAIARDINEKILLPVRELMKNVTEESIVENKELEIIRNEIHHTPLSGESEEIKQQVAKEREVRPTAPLPKNLPTQQESHLETKFPSESKKPSHIDPYREPIE